MSRLAVVPVRDGVVPAGGRETVAECGGNAFVVGAGAEAAAAALAGVARGTVHAWDTPGFRAAAWAAVLAAVVAEHDVVVGGAERAVRLWSERLERERQREIGKTPPRAGADAPLVVERRLHEARDVEEAHVEKAVQAGV